MRCTHCGEVWRFRQTQQCLVQIQRPRLPARLFSLRDARAQHTRIDPTLRLCRSAHQFHRARLPGACHELRQPQREDVGRTAQRVRIHAGRPVERQRQPLEEARQFDAPTVRAGTVRAEGEVDREFVELTQRGREGEIVPEPRRESPLAEGFECSAKFGAVPARGANQVGKGLFDCQSILGTSDEEVRETRSQSADGRGRLRCPFQTDIRAR